MVSGLDHGIITMKKGETALFTLPPELAHGDAGNDIIPPFSVVRFEVQLFSWITVVDVSKDGGIIKKIMEKGEGNEGPGDLDEVFGTVMAYSVTFFFSFTFSDQLGKKMRMVSMLCFMFLILLMGAFGIQFCLRAFFPC